MAKKNSIMSSIFILLNLFTFNHRTYWCKSRHWWCKLDWILLRRQRLDSDSSRLKKLRNKNAVEFHIRAEPTVEYSVPFYIKIEVSMEKDNSFFLCFSHDDLYCETRDILMKNPGTKSVYIWAKKEQYEKASFDPYFTIKCARDVKSCAYTIKSNRFWITADAR